MCGIAGVHFEGGANRDTLRDAVTRMTRSLHHRGPEAGGLWLDHRAGIGLGHRRLAILDLTEAGHQPFVSASGRFVLTFNGEIYNFAELRLKIHYPFRTRTDTEVLIAAIEDWGVERTLRSLDGMYAFGVWDRHERKLILARDRFGEKPLFYSAAKGGLWFASELRAFESLADFDLRIDEVAQDHFLRFGYVSGPRTIWQGISSLPPNHARFGSDGTLQESVSMRPPPAFTGSQDDAVQEFETRIERAVRSRLISDVPVGLFLSGGIDSSLIAIYAPHVRTFTAGFEEDGFDESEHARYVSERLATSHEMWRISPAEARAAIPDLANVFDQPFADSSQLPTLLLARRVRRHVTVALGGDGGDELFAAYARYGQLARLMKLPKWVRAAASAAGRLGGGEKGKLLADSANAKDLAALYSGIMGGTGDAGSVSDPIEWMCAHDIANYLPDDLLVKLDRCAMSVALETRLPFLSPDVADFARSLPMSMRRDKKIPRLLLARHFPGKFSSRPKKGFRAPIRTWLMGPLRDWAEDLVPGIVREIPAGDRCVRVWSRLMLAAWLRRRAVQATASCPLQEPVAVPD